MGTDGPLCLERGPVWDGRQVALGEMLFYLIIASFHLTLCYDGLVVWKNDVIL